MKTRILVETHVIQIGSKSITMEHFLVDELTNEVLSTSVAVLVCYDIKNQISISIPEHWRKSILTYDENVIVK